jgi:cholesterol 24(S)-hydroxylase
MTDDFVTFFVAGQETTANTLSFSFQEIGRHPEIAQKAREEIDRVLGERTEVTYQDVSELKYCTAIFKEALRLYPPAASVLRFAPEEVDVHGIKIPKNTPFEVNNIKTVIFLIFNYNLTYYFFNSFQLM